MSSRPVPLGRAWAAVLWERLWPAVVPALSVLGLFAALALSDLLVVLPGWLHTVALVAFAAALVYGVVRGWTSFRPVQEGGQVDSLRFPVINRLRHL